MPGSASASTTRYGQAYGFTTENAWVVDLETGRSFFLAATLYTNEDGVLNDDQYDYATVAAPFYAALGEALGRWFWEGKLSSPSDQGRGRASDDLAPR